MNLSNYRILETLSVRDRAETYQGREIGTGRLVVIQFLELRNPALLEQMRRQLTAASALNHINICKVYEASDLEGRTVLVRQYVEGPSLRAYMAGRQLPYMEALNIAGQIASALETADSVAIHHGDLRPERMYMGAGQRVVITGFGSLRCEDEAPAKRHESFDLRDDLHALGTILFEMLTGEAPDLEAPRSAVELRHDLPPAAGRVLHALLEPDRERRFQSAAGVSTAIRLLRRNAVTEEGLEHARMYVGRGERVRRRRRQVRRKWRPGRLVRPVVVCTAAGLVIALACWGVRRAWPRGVAEEKMKIDAVTQTGDVVGAALSPDGRRFAHVRSVRGRESVWLARPLAEGFDIMVPATDGSFHALAFSDDGRMLQFVKREGAESSFYKLALDVRRPTRIVGDVRYATVARGRSLIAYIRCAGNGCSVGTANINGSGERVLVSKPATDAPLALAWSPDGKRLAMAVRGVNGATHLESIEVAEGVAAPLGRHTWRGDTSLKWLPDGRGLFVTGADANGDAPIWRVSFPEGTVSRVTTDHYTYRGLSMSDDGRTIVTVRHSNPSGIWVAPNGDETRARQLTSDGSENGAGGLAWLPDGGIVFTARDGADHVLASIDTEGRRRKNLASSAEALAWPTVSADGQVAYVAYRSSVPRIWTVHASGQNPHALTEGAGEWMPSFSPDSRLLYYIDTVAGSGKVWKMPAAGGSRPETVVSQSTARAAVSPDGRWIACRLQGRENPRVQVLAIEDGAPVATMEVPPGTAFGWSPKGDAIIWAHNEGGTGNLRQQMLDGSGPLTITTFTEREIFAWAWSPDGKWLALARGYSVGNAVRIRPTL